MFTTICFQVETYSFTIIEMSAKSRISLGSLSLFLAHNVIVRDSKALKS